MARVNKAKTEENRWAAYEYRLDGWSFRQIAAHLEVSVGAAYKYVQEAYKELENETPEAVEEIRLAELQRLDMLLKGLAPMAHVGNVGAVTAYLKVMERRAKMLGLDAPEKKEIDVKDWRSQAIAAIQDGKLGYDDLVDLFDEDVANDLLYAAKLGDV